MDSTSASAAAAAIPNDPFSAYGTDPALEEEGVWSNEFKGGLEVKIRSTQSREVKAAYARINKRSARYLRAKEEIPEAVELKNNVDLACAAVADWRQRVRAAGQPDVVRLPALDGTELACTTPNKRRIFADRRFWSFRSDVFTKMHEIELFQRQDDEDDMGNSGAPSGPVSSSAPTLVS
jgi:hypothetical protein